MKYIALYNLAVINYQQELYSLARDYVNSAKEIKDNDEIHVLSAEIYSKQGDIKNAVNEYKYLISKEPQNIDYSIFLANIYLEKRKFLEARKVLKSYIKKYPSERNNPKLNAYRNLFL